MSRKASLTANPLGQPTSAIQALAVEFQAFLHFPDPAPLYAVMGAVAANMIPGNPVWLMLIGPPSCGGTALLDTLLSIPRVHGVSSIKGEAVLLSAVAKKDRSSGSTGGLLRLLGDRGLLLIKDFTSMISMPHDALLVTMGALREIYDGRWVRAVGAEGGQSMVWEGKIGLLAKCTGVIDQHHSLSADMGERWMYFRYPNTDGYGESMKSFNTIDPGEAKRRVQEIVKAFFEGLDLDWSAQLRRSLFQAERNRLVAVATFAARARSSVRRHAYTREVEDMPQLEVPTRLASALGQLYLGMELIGVEPDECWRITIKIALDCLPQVRKTAIEIFMSVGDIGATNDDLRKVLHCSQATVRRLLEDMVILGLVDKKPDRAIWTLSEWSRGELRVGWGID